MENGAAAEPRRSRIRRKRAAGALLLFTAPVFGQNAAMIAAGRTIALAPDKGNCVACHAIQGAEQAGDVGPALHDLKRRFPDQAVLRARLRDARDFNPDTLMPPYGRYRLLTDEEIETLVQFLYTL